MIPEISIITVVKNDSCGLQKTLHSLKIQSLVNWECLIISAKSEDDTQNVAHQFSENDYRIIHQQEVSPGIYASMNQGLSLARAPFVIFMNAGDVFAFPKAIEVLNLEILKGNYPVVVGGYSTDDKEYSFKKKHFGPDSFSLNRRWGCHQSMIFNRSEVISVGGFSQEYKIASDFNLVLKLVSKKDGMRLSKVVSVINPNGISNTQIRKVLHEKQQIRNEHFGPYSVSSLLGNIWTYLVLSKIRLRLLFTKIL